MKLKKIVLGVGLTVLSLTACDNEPVVTNTPDNTTTVESISSEESNSSNKESTTDRESNVETTTETTTTTSEVTSSETTTSTPTKTTTTTTTTKVDPVITETKMSILASGAGQETIYAEFNPVADCTEYHAYYKDSNSDKWVKADDQLIRRYVHNDSYKYRVDVVGIKAGLYDLKIETTINGVTEVGAKVEKLSAVAYDRSGFAFSSTNGSLKTGSGAYNDDGTLKNGAQVIYVDSSNAKTVTATVNGAKQTGLQAILDAKQKKTAKEILDIRFIGEIKDSDVDGFSSSAEGLQIKGAASYQQMDITIEGIGEDACVNGFGFLVRNSGNVEIRNIGVLNFKDDGISVDTDNTNLWIHDNDFFYGKAGGDSDQAKGDGTTDLKGDSKFLTVSYNHYYDSGKSSLCGMKSESGPNYITYHHNWFDHSDSRHPRVRSMSVHVYNNYYDGNAKYGVGSTMGSSVFVEGNYFRNCKWTMLTSQQGNDILGDPEGNGTFSGEDGGVIKAFNNTIIGDKGITYYQDNNVDYDAYLASSRDEKISDSVKSKKGGHTYDNFDTTVDLGVKEENIQTPEAARDTTKEYAGRLNGGDFKWTFSEAEDSDYSVNKELKAAVTNYTNKNLISTLNSTEPVVHPDEPTPTTTTSNQGGQTSSSGIIYVSSKQIHNDSNIFTTAGSIKDKDIASYIYGDLTLTQALKMDSKGSIEFTLTEAKTIVIVASAKQVGGTLAVGDQIITLETTPKEYTIQLEAGTYKIAKPSSGKGELYVYVVEIL